MSLVRGINLTRPICVDLHFCWGLSYLGEGIVSSNTTSSNTPGNLDSGCQYKSGGMFLFVRELARACYWHTPSHHLRDDSLGSYVCQILKLTMRPATKAGSGFGLSLTQLPRKYGQPLLCLWVLSNMFSISDRLICVAQGPDTRCCWALISLQNAPLPCKPFETLQTCSYKPISHASNNKLR
jgi:hypothetical protein